MEANQLLECGKVMQLAGLSSAQWNGCIVSIEERSIDNGETRCTCELIFGESKGKKLKVKEANLIEVSPPSPERRKYVQDELTKLYYGFKDAREAGKSSEQQETINSFLNKAKDLNAEVPNCCLLWDLLGQFSKFI